MHLPFAERVAILHLYKNHFPLPKLRYNRQRMQGKVEAISNAPISE